MDSKPLFRKISKTSHDGYRFYYYGENTFFSTLFVDDNHLLQYVDSDYVHPTSEYPFGTISFNGKPVPNNCF